MTSLKSEVNNKYTMFLLPCIMIVCLNVYKLKMKIIYIYIYMLGIILIFMNLLCNLKDKILLRMILYL